MLPINWNTALQYANLIQLAYSILPTNDENALTTQLAPLGYDYLQTIYANELATDIDPHIGEIVSFGFLAVSKTTKELIAIIRGTETIAEWMHDASFLMVPSPISGIHGFTEDGFTAVYRSLRVARDPDALCARDAIKNYLHDGTATCVTVCGHSLGAALATLLTVDVAINTPCNSPISYTYASPRVGDHFFAGSYSAVVPATYRIANRQDLVPKLPSTLPLPYEHVNTEYELIPPAGKFDQSVLCMHIIASYIWLIKSQAGIATGDVDAKCAYKAEAFKL